jgi:2-oxoglutarate dehydrogenase complex dehydrogenase (E1) component-like enzyme
MDVLDVERCVATAIERAREEREPQLVEAVTYRYRGHSMADPEEYRTKDEVEDWRTRDPLATFPARLVEEGVLSAEDVERLDGEAIATVDEAVEFADDSRFPDLASLYDDIYVIGDQVRDPWWSTDSRSPDVHRGEQEREAGDVAQELAEAGAAYADETDPDTRAARARGAGG